MGNAYYSTQAEVVIRAFSDCSWISYSVVNLTCVIIVCVCLSMCSTEAGYDWYIIG